MDWKAIFEDDVVTSRLTPSQVFEVREGDVHVRRGHDWLEIQDEFIRQARCVGVMSIDTENLLQPEAARLSKFSPINFEVKGMGVVWVIATSGEGLTARFDIRSLRSDRFPVGGEQKTFLDVLPQNFVSLLTDEEVVKVGSGLLSDIAGDFTPLHQAVTPILELQWLVEQARGPVFHDDISVASGLDYVCKLLFGFTYKPVKVKKRAPTPKGALTFRLYNWPSKLSPRGHNYLRNDSILPISLLYRIVKLLDVQANSMREALYSIFRDLVISNSEAAARSCGKALARPVSIKCWALLDQVEAFHLRLAAGEGEVEVEEDVEMELKEDDRFPEDTSESHVLVDEGESEVKVQDEENIDMEEVPLMAEELELIQTSEVRRPRGLPPLSWFQNRKRRLAAPEKFPSHQLCPDKLETSAQYSYGGGKSGEARPNKNTLRNKRKRKLPGPSTNEEGEKEKATGSAAWFKLGSRCNFCGGAHHARDDCEKWKDFEDKGLFRGCGYPLCKYRIHHDIYRCDVLHGRCYECGLRGHVRGQCEIYDGETLRAIFEESADKGWKTSDRFSFVEWGFYEIKTETHYQEDYGEEKIKGLDYGSLITGEHSRSLLEVKAYNERVAEVILGA